MRARILVWIAVGCGHAAPPTSPAPTKVTSGAATGEVSVAGAPTALSYVFDRNAIAAVRATPRWLVAITTSGNLLRFDPSSLALAGESIAGPSLRCLGGGDPLYAGFAGGLAFVDPRTLSVTPVASFRGEAVWLGTYAHGSRLAVAVITDRAIAVHRFDLHNPRAPLALGPIDIPPGDLPATPESWLVDHDDRLWYGVNAGEWGGSVGRIDLASGKVSAIAGIEEPVMGLVEIDRDVLAYGGLTHIGITEGFIARITGDRAAIVWKHANHDTATKADGPPPLPVVRVWSGGARRRVLVWNEIFDVSADLASWKRIVKVPARIRFGRATSVGADPAITDVVSVASDDLVLASRYDGLFQLHGTAITPHAVADQLEIPVRTILPSTAGVFVTASFDHRPPWRIDRDRWTVVDLAPLGEVFDYAVVARPGHAPWILAERDEGKGLVARWGKSGFEPVWRGDDQGRGGLAIGDQLWMVRDGTLRQFDGHGWREAGSFSGDAYGHAMTAVDDSGLVVDHGHHTLLMIQSQPDSRASLVPATDSKLAVADAIVDGDHVLVATSAGLRTYVRDRHELSASSVPGLQDAAFLARDDVGRIWQASPRAIAVAIGSTLQPVELPVLAGRTIEAFAYDPIGHEILVGLGAAGLVRIAAPGKQPR